MFCSPVSSVLLFFVSNRTDSDRFCLFSASVFLCICAVFVLCLCFCAGFIIGTCVC